MTVSAMKKTPYIRFLNKSLLNSGFKIGEKFEVIYGKDKILLKKVKNARII